MCKDAECHKEEDQKRKESVETRNKADQSMYGAEKALRDTYGDKVPQVRVCVCVATAGPAGGRDMSTWPTITTMDANEMVRARNTPKPLVHCKG